MNRKIYPSLAALLVCTLIVLTGCGGSSSPPPPPVIAIAAIGGSGQEALINVPFGAPLVAKVTRNGAPASGVTVTFTAPASGASGIFASGTATDSEITDLSGTATSSAFTANSGEGTYAVTATASGATTPADFSLTNATPPPPVIAIAAMGGSGQEALINVAFGAPLVAKVTRDGAPASGVTVTFTAPASGASGIFASGTATDSEITDLSGTATSSAFTANSGEGTYAVTATASGATTPADFSLTNATIANAFSFNVTGLEATNCPNGTCSFYALAGTVGLDTNNIVLAGVQDYNDGAGQTSPEPAGDSIKGGLLTVDATGQGTLTLVTDNGALGMGGTETLGVQFVNSKHALIAQFDGSATSSGSLDLQTATSVADGSYAFTLSGVNSSYHPVALGGIFSISGGGLTGSVDVNDSGTITMANAITGSVTPTDMFGRGQITGVILNGVALALNYYVVTPAAIRIIDIDANSNNNPSAGNTAVGSAFGQGSGAFSKASLAHSVFAVESNSWGARFYAAAGSFVPDAATGKFTGVGDDEEEGVLVSASPIFGTYSIDSSGHGGLQIENAGLLDVTSFGVYATDPTLNLLDPNNTTGGGGALVLDLDPTLASGTGVIVPQTDTSASSFAGNYAFAVQDYNSQGLLGWEFDLLGQASVANGVFNGTGFVNDGLAFFSATPTLYTAVPFAGTASPDAANPGRYVMAPLDVTPISGAPVSFSVVIYQASGGLLFWMDEDAASLSLGTIQRAAIAHLAISKRKLEQRPTNPVRRRPAQVR